MDVSYKKQSLTFIGYHRFIDPQKGYEECPVFWEQGYRQRFAHLYNTMTPENALEQAMLDNHIGAYGICLMKDGKLDYWIAGLYSGGEVPSGLEILEVPESIFAMFTTHGPLPDSLQFLNTEIYEKWLPSEGLKHGAMRDMIIEVYSDQDPASPAYECAIWMPVLKGAQL